jgi:hypothetical protein
MRCKNAKSVIRKGNQHNFKFAFTSKCDDFDVIKKVRYISFVETPESELKL